MTMMKWKRRLIALDVINTCTYSSSSSSNNAMYQKATDLTITRREFRQDMGGVGSFNSQNKTLYVGRVAPTDDMEEVVRKHFGAFGEIERSKTLCRTQAYIQQLSVKNLLVRLLEHRGVAFVTYKNRMNAEFAREAMMNQSLDNNEILNVR